MKSGEIREKFLAYFESKGHRRVESSSLKLEGDPTLLFPNAGMNQFKDCFLGAEKRDYNRAATSQKCMRISGKHNDFENVGVTPRHHTFFEMLGNFSFGDYFKAEAIEFGWEFLTDELSLPKERIWITIFEDDDEAEELWIKTAGLPKERIVRLGEKDNFWAMGDTGPCGPCSELHYYLGEDPAQAAKQGLIDDDGSFIEIWNLVFMQFNRSENGDLNPLPKPSVDTGMGLERITAVHQGVPSNYDTDLLRGIISVCEKLSGHQYDGSSYEVRDLRSDAEYARDVAMRVIADHTRAVAFLIGDGVHPSSDGRGYVLRRILRRAVRHGRVLNFQEPFFKHTAAHVIELMGDTYPALKENREVIINVADAEEQRFYETLDAGLSVLQKEIADLPESAKQFPGETAFLLHDTYGFPIDLTEDALKAYNLTVDRPSFEKALAAQKERSREDRRSQGITFQSVSVEGEPTEFLGYENTSAESSLVKTAPEEENGAVLHEGDTATLLFKATPFYAESGGQVADTGSVKLPNAALEVLDVQKTGTGHYLHLCRITEGELPVDETGSAAFLEVDRSRRELIRRNHSATHLVHAALRSILGDHVKQAGSRVDDHSLRFDYNHFEPLTDSQIREIQEYVNAEIRSNHEVSTELMPIEQAKKAGAMALFGEKYGAEVRVVRIGPNSLELCGGTHVSRSGDIGISLLASEGGISAGVRRIECFTGPVAEQEIYTERDDRARIAELLKGDQRELPKKIEKLLSRSRELERELSDLRSQLAQSQSSQFVERAKTLKSGVKVIAEKVSGLDSKGLRSLVDRLRLQLGSGVVVLGSAEGDAAVLVAGVTSDLTQRFHSGSLIQAVAKEFGGKGGGRADFAQAGGVRSDSLPQALNRVFDLVAE